MSVMQRQCVVPVLGYRNDFHWPHRSYIVITIIIVNIIIIIINIIITLLLRKEFHSGTGVRKYLVSNLDGDVLGCCQERRMAKCCILLSPKTNLEEFRTKTNSLQEK